MATPEKIHWYIARSDESQTRLGPFDESEIIEQLQNGIIQWTDGAWNSALDPTWRRIVEIPVFRQYLPKLADHSLLQELIATDSPPPVTAERSRSRTRTRSSTTVPVVTSGSAVYATVPPCPSPLLDSHQPKGSLNPWFLHFEGNRMGPLSSDQIRKMLGKGVYPGSMLAWGPGMTRWIPIQEVPEFKNYFHSSSLPIGRLEKRKAPRAPLSGIVRFCRIQENGALSPNTHLGTSRNISVHGMRIDSIGIPKRVGMQLELHFEPTEIVIIPSFTVRAEVARIDSAGSFGVRFLDLSQNLLEVIKKYIEEHTEAAPIELETFEGRKRSTR